MDTTPARERPYFYIYCEMQDTADALDADATNLDGVPAAVALELAMLLYRFELEIGDDDRARLIEFGGLLLRLDRELNPDEHVNPSTEG